MRCLLSLSSWGPAVGRRISRNASEYIALSRLFAKTLVKEPGECIQGRYIAGDPSRKKKTLRITVNKSRRNFPVPRRRRLLRTAARFASCLGFGFRLSSLEAE